jgi:DNA-binding PadR family transcriptional regulator
MKFDDLLTGFIRLHILHHAAEMEIYGQWMIDELAHHGYRLSPGTLYPMLHAMEKKGYLTSRVQREGRVARKFYKATRLGKQGLALAKVRVREFTGEAMKHGD